jgi:hypothetical protein
MNHREKERSMADEQKEDSGIEASEGNTELSPVETDDSASTGEQAEGHYGVGSWRWAWSPQS